MDRPGVPDDPLVASLRRLRDRIAGCHFPLATPDAGSARAAAQDLVGQLDGYLLPRLRALDAPLLAVVGGPTGAGKSTLTNALAGQVVSPVGVLRPTTRAPVLAYHPADRRWFVEPRVLPALPRRTVEPGARAPAPAGGPQLHLVPAAGLPPGLALLDAPDVDSVVTENRELATQLLAAADLWLFVTSAVRYADAVPWALLAAARERGTVLAVVLDRVDIDARAEAGADLARMLAERGLGEAPLFCVPESPLAAGLLPAAVVAPLRRWLATLAADAAARRAVVRRTLDGVLASLPRRVNALAEAAQAQVRAAAALREEVVSAYAAALAEVDAQVRAGSPPGGARASVAEGLPEAVGSGVEVLVHDTIGWAAERAAERVVAAWRTQPAGAALLAGAGPDATRALGRAAPDLSERAVRLVRDWQGHRGQAEPARQQLHDRVAELYDAEAARFRRLLEAGCSTGPDAGPGEAADPGPVEAAPAALREALDAVERVRRTREAG